MIDTLKSTGKSVNGFRKEMRTRSGCDTAAPMPGNNYASDARKNRRSVPLQAVRPWMLTEGQTPPTEVEACEQPSQARD
jgi:hypothetical protein